MNLKERLYDWRDSEAHSRGIELWRVLPNSALDEIAEREPDAVEQVAMIKGIGPTKLADYGKKIVEIVLGNETESKEKEILVHRAKRDPVPFAPQSGRSEVDAGVSLRDVKRHEKPSISVGFYLEHVNRALRTIPARVRGEVTQFKFQGNAYFTIKDSQEQAVLDVMMFSGAYNLSGIKLEPGMEVIIEGFAEVYKPWGRFSFKATTLEFAGEGALKKQYEDLKKKLTLEGIFAEERKRALPEFPEKIGVITSRTGAVIEDFLNNLGRHGFDARMIDTRVEGAAAATSVLESIKQMRGENIDALVIIRGGGSLESLQAFNNEHVVRAIREFSESKAPVVCAIGHHLDAPLAQMAADLGPSTPTACALLLNKSWDDAVAHVEISEERMLNNYSRVLDRKKQQVAQAQYYLENKFGDLRNVAERVAQEVRAYVPVLALTLARYKESIDAVRLRMIGMIDVAIDRTREALDRASRMLDARDPMRQLALGYSVARVEGKIVRRVSDVAPGELLQLQVTDGAIDARVEKIYGSKESGR